MDEPQLDVIVHSAERMDRLIQDLLDISRIEEGRLSIKPEPERVAALVGDGCESCRRQADEESIDLFCDVSDDVPSVAADRDRIHQVLSNLVGNAVKFTPGGGRITVRAEMHGEDAVRFSVSDTGPGIPAEDIEHLFDRFWQAKRERRGGAGLGLAIAKGIVERHGGEIRAESSEGEGSTFSFTVPVADSR